MAGELDRGQLRGAGEGGLERRADGAKGDGVEAAAVRAGAAHLEVALADDTEMRDAAADDAQPRRRVLLAVGLEPGEGGEKLAVRAADGDGGVDQQRRRCRWAGAGLQEVVEGVEPVGGDGEAADRLGRGRRP